VSRAPGIRMGTHLSNYFVVSVSLSLVLRNISVFSSYTDVSVWLVFLLLNS
jgi:hypothetical protein